MPEIAETLEVDIPCETMRLITHANGDTLTISDVELDTADAATLAWLINHSAGTLLTLKLEVKV
jgi:hypothetical protein